MNNYFRVTAYGTNWRSLDRCVRVQSMYKARATVRRFEREYGNLLIAITVRDGWRTIRELHGYEARSSRR